MFLHYVVVGVRRNESIIIFSQSPLHMKVNETGIICVQLLLSRVLIK